MNCNFGDPMSLRHPVEISVITKRILVEGLCRGLIHRSLHICTFLHQVYIYTHIHIGLPDDKGMHTTFSHEMCTTFSPAGVLLTCLEFKRGKFVKIDMH